MRTGRRRKIYWDTTCWLAWLNGEGTDVWPAAVVQGIEDVVEEVNNGAALLFTSAIFKTEIYVGRLTEARRDDYQRIMRRRNVREMDGTPKVTELASIIREHHDKEGRKVHTADAIHLATAIIYQADEFHTMDGLQQGGSKRRKLLSLSGNVAGYPLKIVNPYPLHGPPPSELVTVTGPLFEGAPADYWGRPSLTSGASGSEGKDGEKASAETERTATEGSWPGTAISRVSTVPRLGPASNLSPEEGSRAGEDEAREK
jgi:predicted nucleic acid-binding protein